jgi:hypothetical protein
MYKQSRNTTIATLLLALMVGCSEEQPELPLWQRTDDANLLFEIELDSAFYRLSNFGEPPQMALWIEQVDGSEIRTLWVSHRLARGVWVGKVVCPTALPYWISRREIEDEGGLPSFLSPLPDGITGATPKKELRVYTKVDPGSHWKYYLELNVSGDYNATYLSAQPNGKPDPDGNGQPSLIYAGEIIAANENVDTAVIVGRTEQLKPVSDIIPDLSGLTTAQQVLKKLTVTHFDLKGDTHD